MDDSIITPGSPVRMRDGDQGVVDRVITDAAGQDLEALVVRPVGGGGVYRVPMKLISEIRREDGADVVFLAADFDTLGQNEVADLRFSYPADETAQVTASRSTTHTHDGGGLIDRLHSGLGALAGAMTGTAGAASSDDVDGLRIPLVEEELAVQARPVRTGTLRVHKSVDTVQETVTVAVSHEEPEVEIVPVDAYDPKAPYHPGDTYIPIIGEELVVEKRQVITGYLHVHKRVVIEDQVVTETLRREHVGFDQDGAPVRQHGG